MTFSNVTPLSELLRANPNLTWQSQTPPAPNQSKTFTKSGYPGTPLTPPATWSPLAPKRPVADPVSPKLHPSGISVVPPADSTVALTRLQWKVEREELTRKREILLQEIASMKDADGTSLAKGGAQASAQAHHKEPEGGLNKVPVSVANWKCSVPDVTISESGGIRESPSSSLQEEFKTLRSRKQQLLQELATVQGASLDITPDQNMTREENVNKARSVIREEISSLSCQRAGLLREIAALQAKQKLDLQDELDEELHVSKSHSQSKQVDVQAVKTFSQSTAASSGSQELEKHSQAEEVEGTEGAAGMMTPEGSPWITRKITPDSSGSSSGTQAETLQSPVLEELIAFRETHSPEQESVNDHGTTTRPANSVSPGNSLADPCVQTLVGLLKKGLTDYNDTTRLKSLLAEYGSERANADSTLNNAGRDIMPFAPLTVDCNDPFRKATGSTRSGTPCSSRVEDTLQSQGEPAVVGRSTGKTPGTPNSEKSLGSYRRSMVALPASRVQETLRLLRPQSKEPMPPRQPAVASVPTPPLRPRRSPSPTVQPARSPSPPARSVFKRDRSPARSAQETREAPQVCMDPPPARSVVKRDRSPARGSAQETREKLQVFLDPAKDNVKQMAMLRAAEGLLLESLPPENVENLHITALAPPSPAFVRILQMEGSSRSRLQVAWHLAGAEAADEIQAAGIRCDEQHCSCGRYGRGGYVATSASKANAYADSEGSGGDRCLFLVLVLPGEDVVLGKRGMRPTCTAADHATHPTEFCFVDQSRLHCACRLDYCWVPTGRRSKATTVGNHVRAWRATSPGSPKAAPRRLKWQMQNFKDAN